MVFVPDVPDDAQDRESKRQKLEPNGTWSIWDLFEGARAMFSRLFGVPWKLQVGEFPRNIALPFKVPDMDMFGNEIDEAIQPNGNDDYIESNDNDEIIELHDDGNINDVKKFCYIKAKYHEDSGLAPYEKEKPEGEKEKPEDVILYCRRAFRQQAGFLEKYAIRCPALCWVDGPPGSGKSCATFAFALSLDPSTWNVIWIHYIKQYATFQCVRFQADKKQTFEFSTFNLQKVMPRLLNGEQPSADKKTIIFLDGYVDESEPAKQVWAQCTVWHQGDKMRRRFVCICSMTSRGKESMFKRSYIHVDYNGVKTKYFDPIEWQSWSWSLEEYLIAVKVDEFYDTVKDTLIQDATLKEKIGNQQADRVELVTSKFNFAGGNARFMFAVTCAVVIMDLDQAMNSAGDLRMYTDGRIGIHSTGVMNRLLSIQVDEGNTNEKTYPVLSRYVGITLGTRFGPDVINRLKSALGIVNPALDGHLLEAFFLAKIPREDVKLSTLEDDVPIIWSRCNTVIECFPKMESLGITLNDTRAMWLRPTLWNQAGYDALYIDKAKGFVRFVQITRASSHKFVPQAFRDVLRTVGKAGMEIVKVELAFVVPESILDHCEFLDDRAFNTRVLQNFNSQIASVSDKNKTYIVGEVKVYGLH